MHKRILFALLLMGFTSLVVQTLLIREFLISFYGNELTIGLILGNWIILANLRTTFELEIHADYTRIYADLGGVYLRKSVLDLRES